MDVAQLQEAVLEACNAIYDDLGGGASERIYHNALEVELRQRSIPYETERIVCLNYMGHGVGHVRVDLVVDCKLIVELKALYNSDFPVSAKQQLGLYTRLLGMPGLLINFVQAADGSVIHMSKGC